MHARMKKIQSNNDGNRVATTYLPLKLYRDFSQRTRVANTTIRGPIWPNFELIIDIIAVLATCKKEEDPIRNEGARVVTTLCIDFSDA